jgi:hypothetical protein
MKLAAEERIVRMHPLVVNCLPFGLLGKSLPQLRHTEGHGAIRMHQVLRALHGDIIEEDELVLIGLLKVLWLLLEAMDGLCS